jgi:hypothetical protein
VVALTAKAAGVMVCSGAVTVTLSCDEALSSDLGRENCSAGCCASGAPLIRDVMRLWFVVVVIFLMESEGRL